MSTFYNPDQLKDNKRFNTESRQNFEYITDEQRDEALKQLDKLVEDTRTKLGD